MNRIAELRKEIGMSQADLAKHLDMHQTAVSHWELGRSRPGFDKLNELSQLFDTNITYILGNSEERTKVKLTDEEIEKLGRWEVEEHEAEIIAAYKRLDHHGKNAVEAIIKAESLRVYEQQREKELASNGE